MSPVAVPAHANAYAENDASNSIHFLLRSNVDEHRSMAKWLNNEIIVIMQKAKGARQILQTDRSETLSLSSVASFFIPPTIPSQHGSVNIDPFLHARLPTAIKNLYYA